jgi:rRNA maturation endonuclease Nob1
MRCKACDEIFRATRQETELCPRCVRAAAGTATEAELARQIVSDHYSEGRTPPCTDCDDDYT